MKNLIKFAAVSIAFGLPALSLACEYPEHPTLPDGSVAAKEDMIAAQKAVKEFLAQVDEYLTCIEEAEKVAIEEMGLDPDTEEGQKALARSDELLTKRFDAANEEKFLFGEKWNQQVRAYNEARKAAKSE
jgi:hypothetical protein